ncbi:hypothetical protein LTAR_00970 [Leptolinea tardivitalis]|nr:hypothetical protein LTAR_00970 [Leptolinea tardivitalis]
MDLSSPIDLTLVFVSIPIVTSVGMTTNKRIGIEINQGCIQDFWIGTFVNAPMSELQISYQPLVLIVMVEFCLAFRESIS